MITTTIKTNNIKSEVKDSLKPEVIKLDQSNKQEDYILLPANEYYQNHLLKYDVQDINILIENGQAYLLNDMNLGEVLYYYNIDEININNLNKDIDNIILSLDENIYYYFNEYEEYFLNIPEFNFNINKVVYEIKKYILEDVLECYNNNFLSNWLNTPYYPIDEYLESSFYKIDFLEIEKYHLEKGFNISDELEILINDNLKDFKYNYLENLQELLIEEYEIVQAQAYIKEIENTIQYYNNITNYNLNIKVQNLIYG